MRARTPTAIQPQNEPGKNAPPLHDSKNNIAARMAATKINSRSPPINNCGRFADSWNGTSVVRPWLNDRRAYREQASQQGSRGNDESYRADGIHGAARKFIPLTSEHKRHANRYQRDNRDCPGYGTAQRLLQPC